MKVICKQTTSKGFDLKEVTTVFSNDHDYNVGGYGIELNKEYLVMGIAIYQDTNCVYYLIDMNGKPDWLPYPLFKIIDNTLPNNWFVKVNGRRDDTDIYLLSGFDELCNDNNFYDQLIDRNEIAMRTYFKRKIEFENRIDEISN